MNEHQSNQVESIDVTDPQCNVQVPTRDSNKKPSLLEVLRHHIKSFNGSDDAREWLKHIQSKFSAFNLTFKERFQIIPYFFEDDVFIWYALNQDKVQSYAHLCQLFIHEYFKLKQNSDLDANVDLGTTNKYLLLRQPVVTNEIAHDYGLGFQKDKSSSIQLTGAVVTRPNSKTTPQHITSSSPSQHISSSTQSPNDFNYSNPDEKSFDITMLKEYQFNDKQVQKGLNGLKENINTSFVYQDGILDKLASIPYGKTKRKLFYIPSSMIKHLLISYHNNPLIGGYFAIRRTLEKLKQQFWWPDRPLLFPDN
ncbi:unnamed protein product [Adineta steineri]|uniref:Integrase zinc-binding domain-containing protein n=1 Tax=Adineta steineri TaxID=433720 RepID=A0A820DCY3_9BILA|nr:unnamed protein product [Adineta steineri]CAF4230218.1 unnamed protein product [Adineta steineri]